MLTFVVLINEGIKQNGLPFKRFFFKKKEANDSKETVPISEKKKNYKLKKDKRNVTETYIHPKYYLPQS